MSEDLTRACLVNPKKCIDCKRKKPASEFYIKSKYRITSTGERVKSYLLNSVCKKCHIKRTTKWRLNNKERFNAYQRDYAKKHSTK